MGLAAAGRSREGGCDGTPPATGGLMIRRPRAVIDLSALPDVVFGPRDIMWWGTLGFVLIEGFTLVLCAAVYIYLQQNFTAWPPEGTPLPRLLVPSIQLVVMVLSLALVQWLKIGRAS